MRELAHEHAAGSLGHEAYLARDARSSGFRLSAAAHAEGLALALPTKVALARPTGFEPTRTHAGLKSIPIEVADDWEVATMHSA